MNEDTPQPNVSYTFELPQFTLNMIFKSNEQSKQIQMSFAHHQKQYLYQLIINQEVIDWDNNLSVYFKSPQILFEDMVLNSKGLSITAEGVVIFELKIGRRAECFKFTAKRQQISKEQVMQVRLNQLLKDNDKRFKEIRQQNRLLRQQISKLVSLQNYQINNGMILKQFEVMQGKMSQVQSQLMRLKQQNNQIKQHAQQSKNNAQQILEQNNKMKKQIQILKNRAQCHDTEFINYKNQKQKQYNQLLLKNIQKQFQYTKIREQCFLLIKNQFIEKDKKIQRLQKQIERLNNGMKMNQSVVQSFKQQIQMNSYTNITSNTAGYEPINQNIQSNNLTFFQQEQIQDKKLITYISGNYWHGYFHQFFIKPGKITKLHVKQVGTLNQQIMYGISTDEIIGHEFNYKHNLCKSYRAWSGKICQNGSARKGGPIIYDGSDVTIIADMIKWRIIWQIDGDKVEESAITAAMRACKLYFFVGMYDQTDQIEILNCQ